MDFSTCSLFVLYTCCSFSALSPVNSTLLYFLAKLISRLNSELRLSDIVSLLHCICRMQWHMKQCVQTKCVPSHTNNEPPIFYVDVCIPEFTENQASKGISVHFISMEFAGKSCPCRAWVREFAPCVMQPQHHRNKSCNRWYCKTNMRADLIKTQKNPFIWVHLCHTLLHAALWTNTEGRLWASSGNF